LAPDHCLVDRLGSLIVPLLVGVNAHQAIHRVAVNQLAAIRRPGHVCRPRFGVNISLVSQPRLAKMHLVINTAREKMQTLSIYFFISFGIYLLINALNKTIFYKHIAYKLFIFINYSS